MNKKDYFLLFLLGILILGINFLFQKHPGYMDAEYYFLGGEAIAVGEWSDGFVWNYLDDPEILPNPLFTYWKPFPSILAALTIELFGFSNFTSSRIIFYLLAALISPLSALLGYTLSRNRFVSYFSGLIALFSGFYFKYLTIPETFTPYILLGGIFFFLVFRLLKQQISPLEHKIEVFFIGLIAGMMHITRVEGILFLFFSICLLAYISMWRNGLQVRSWKNLLVILSLLMTGYILPTATWMVFQDFNQGNIGFSGGLRALWIRSYDDTFRYPPSDLSFQFWLRSPPQEKLQAVSFALRQNFGSFVGVQLTVIGLPFFIWYVLGNFRKAIIRFYAITAFVIFFMMSFVFPYAGSRGGYLHAASAFQIVNWVFIAAGFNKYILWGIKKRGWKQRRAQIMFGGALLVFQVAITGGVYFRDVIGKIEQPFIWNQEYLRYSAIENIIDDYSGSKNEIVMINNPVGYHYHTDRWSIVIPNGETEAFLSVVNKFNVRYVVIDENIPALIEKYPPAFFEKNFKMISVLQDGTKIYETFEQH